MLNLDMAELVKPFSIGKGYSLYNHYVYEAALAYAYLVYQLGREKADDLLDEIHTAVNEKLERQEEEDA